MPLPLKQSSLSGAFVVCLILVVGCATAQVRPQQATASECDIATAAPWINRWLAAWRLTSREILRIPDAPTPDFLFYDAKCAFGTSGRIATVPMVPGPSLSDAPLLWFAAPHNDTLTMPTMNRRPVALMSFTDVDKQTSHPFFVMAAPDYWTAKTGPGDFTPVFLHEFAHTRQMKGFASILGPIDSTWKFPFDLTDDAVQEQFKSDSVYVRAYLAERDLLYRAAAAESPAETRKLAAEALRMIRARHAKWFVGDNSVFSVLDDMWLSVEGAAQWAGYAWLAHPAGGALSKPAAVARMLGRRRIWSQDEGLGLFLVIDRLMPAWPTLVFNNPSIGGIQLLQRAIELQPD